MDVARSLWGLKLLVCCWIIDVVGCRLFAVESYWRGEMDAMRIRYLTHAFCFPPSLSDIFP